MYETVLLNTVVESVVFVIVNVRVEVPVAGGGYVPANENACA